MAFKTPRDITAAAIEAGTMKASLSPDKLLLAGGLAGVYIAFGALFGVVVSAGLNPVLWGGIPALITGAAFSFGLMLVVITGAELVTGVIPLISLAAMKKRITWGQWGTYLLWTTIGALAGSLLVAYFLGVKSGVLMADGPLKRLTAIATLKGQTETDWQIFLRGVGCNWLVCLAVWMALSAEDIAGKMLAIFFPITAFVAMGFDHLVANMFFLPAAHFAGTGLAWSDVLRNWAFAGAGNFVGALCFMAGAYWYLFAREMEMTVTPGSEVSVVSSANGAGTIERELVRS